MMEIPTLSRLPADLRIREYQPTDLDSCLDIYRSNLREFLPDTIELFENHLSEPLSYYLVIETASSILACGGLDIRGDCNEAGFTFGMVRRDLHGLGLGSLLTLTRLALLDGEYDPAFVGLETSLIVEPFYRRFGFKRSSEPDKRYPGGGSYVSMSLSFRMQQRCEIRAHLALLPVTLHVELPDFRQI